MDIKLLNSIKNKIKKYSEIKAVVIKGTYDNQGYVLTELFYHTPSTKDWEIPKVNVYNLKEKEWEQIAYWIIGNEKYDVSVFINSNNETIIRVAR